MDRVPGFRMFRVSDVAEDLADFAFGWMYRVYLLVFSGSKGR